MRPMRTTMVALALSALLIGPVTAQAYFGITAGPTLSVMTGSFIEQSDGVEWGVEFNGRFETRLFGNTWFRTGLGFAQKGGSKLTLANGDTETYGFKTAYLRFPLVLRQEFTLGDGPWAIGPYAGFAIGSNSGCSVKPGEELEFPYTCADSLPGGEVQAIEASIPLGADVWIQFPGASRFLLGVKYEIGLTNVLQEAADAGQAAKHNVFVAYFGFMLPLFVESP